MMEGEEKDPDPVDYHMKKRNCLRHLRVCVCRVFSFCPKQKDNHSPPPHVLSHGEFVYTLDTRKKQRRETAER